MNWEQSNKRSPHVEHFPTTPLFPTTPSQNSTSFWPTPASQPGLSQTPILGSVEQFEGGYIKSLEDNTPTRQPHPVPGGGQKARELEARLATHTQHYSPSPDRPLPPVQHSQRLSSSTLRSPYEHQGPFQTPQSAKGQLLQTPPQSATHFEQRPGGAFSGTPTMADPRRLSSHTQRPLMGPPETPSRGMIQASPGLFPNLQFSPDLFSHQSMDPASAPVYPQQRLFWDPSATPVASTPHSFHTPAQYHDDINSTFAATPTAMPPTYSHPQEPQQYDLPTVSRSMSASYMDNSAFPAPFQTSPRMPLPQQDNPTLFLSSPARRFGGGESNTAVPARRTVPELPAYHHQIQESMRERELARDRRRSRVSKHSADDDLIMKSVRRALSPSKQLRPGLQRSNTHTGVRSNAPNNRRQVQVAFAETASIGSNGSSRSGRLGRSSPVRRMREHERQLSSGSITKTRTSMSLAIDANGIARAIMTSLPEDDDDMEVEDDSVSEPSSRDENDDQMLYSFAAEEPDLSLSTSLGDAREQLRANTHLRIGSDKVAKLSQNASNIDPRLATQVGPPMAGARRSHGNTMNTEGENAGNGNAQQALRAIMQDRSRSTSSHEHQPSNASMQFHSSPPIQSNQFGAYNGSPTTITDPDLATPSTDADSLSSAGATRCVCNSSSPDGNIMIQCDSCSKWLHAKCVGLKNKNLPEVYVCTFCERTPVRQGVSRSTIRSSLHANRSPLAHKSVRHR